nr:helicase-related protein [Candidatus Freyarchaeota archaeon]
MYGLNEIRMQLDELKKQVEEAEKETVQAVCRQFSASLWQEIKSEEVLAFVKKPYAIVPYKQGEWRLFIPRFIPLEVGWLEFQTSSYNVFRVNRYVDWLTPLPDVLKDELGIELPEFKVALDSEHNIVVLEEGDVIKFKKKYQLFFGRQISENSFQIKGTKKFSLVIELLKDGVMPFRPAPVNHDDILEEERVKFELRDYQKEAWELFLKYSHVGVFYPWGAGKSMLGLYAIGKIRGEKLVVVPTVTLREQWAERIKNQLDVEPNEVKIVTYHSAVKESAEKEYSLIVFDEVHHLPSNVFSVLSFLKRKYTIGLSGSPYREDGRSELIFALTGYPIGVAWSYFFNRGLVRKPTVKLIIVREENEKLAQLDSLMAEPGITLVYCDNLKKGEMIANRFSGIFINGETKNRLETVRSALNKDGFVILSRVGDEGISLPQIQRVIEYDYLFGSRRQEAQRAGRLFHAIEEGEHIILMTLDEYRKYKKRLYSLTEKGIEIKIENLAYELTD